MFAAEAIYSRFALLVGTARECNRLGWARTYSAAIKSWPQIRAKEDCKGGNRQDNSYQLRMI